MTDKRKKILVLVFLIVVLMFSFIYFYKSNVDKGTQITSTTSKPVPTGDTGDLYLNEMTEKEYNEACAIKNTPEHNEEINQLSAIGQKGEILNAKEIEKCNPLKSYDVYHFADGEYENINLADESTGRKYFSSVNGNNVKVTIDGEEYEVSNDKNADITGGEVQNFVVESNDGQGVYLNSLPNEDSTTYSDESDSEFSYE